MNKWSYLKISIAVNLDKILVECSQIGDENFDQIFLPGYKAKQLFRPGYFEIKAMGKGFQEYLRLEDQILDYLGSQGWEAYAHENGTYYFKRQITS